jgi:hypothetical protein
MKYELQIITQDNQKFVPIKPICTQLGINYTTQLERLKNDPIMGSTVPLRGMVGADGKNREMVCIPFKYAFMWLSKINPHNVDESARPGLIAAQSKAYDLLWDTLVSYQNYVEYRNRSIEEQIAIRDAQRINFNQAKNELAEAEHELKARLAVTFQNYLEENTQLKIEFIEGSEVPS